MVPPPTNAAKIHRLPISLCITQVNGRFRIEYSKRKPELNISFAEVAGYFGRARPKYSLLDYAGCPRHRLRWNARLPLCPAVVLSSRVEVSESCPLLDDAGSTRRRHRWSARLPRYPAVAFSSRSEVLEGCWLQEMSHETVSQADQTVSQSVSQ